MTSGSVDQSSGSAPNLSAMALTLKQSCVELMADYGVTVTPQKWRVDPESLGMPLIAESPSLDLAAGQSCCAQRRASFSRPFRELAGCTTQAREPTRLETASCKQLRAYENK